MPPKAVKSAMACLIPMRSTRSRHKLQADEDRRLNELVTAAENDGFQDDDHHVATAVAVPVNLAIIEERESSLQPNVSELSHVAPSEQVEDVTRDVAVSGSGSGDDGDGGDDSKDDGANFAVLGLNPQTYKYTSGTKAIPEGWFESWCRKNIQEAPEKSLWSDALHFFVRK